MPDISEVLTKMAQLAVGTIYPLGTDVRSIANCRVDIAPGWPVKDNLDRAMQNGDAIISVWALPGERNTTRYPRVRQVGAAVDNNSKTVVMETKRQERQISYIVWASSPAQRDLLAGTLDNKLSMVDRFDTPDGGSCRMTYAGSINQDMLQKATIFRRDLTFKVEYPTINTETEYIIKQNIINVSNQSDNLIASLVT